ncbi:hypothetical protein B4N89_35530 [Embleya scabrispora]|uniref:Uncharacterized protein n=1 Tax=Embleya scabrispora TaxID=159449 RepID=A0A1T3NRC8_9ACTN|nr:hypothetical protein [Embleya scabrispora]OPC79356.1 hypothetical protein B4N89_35530 [Embleya scabrispora]
MTTPSTSRDAYRPAGSAEDRAAVWSALLDIYAGFTAGDRERIDRRIHPEATIWDSAAPNCSSAAPTWTASGPNARSAPTPRWSPGSTRATR